MSSPVEAKKPSRSWLIGTLVLLWGIFTVSLICWWYIFSQRQIAKLSVAGGVLAEELVKNQKMLMWEGATLLLFLVFGALALGYFVVRDRRHSERLMNFFLTFTHELKTPIASLRLYSETITENIRGEENAVLGKEMMREVDRLSLQLENSLALAQIQEARLYNEPISLKELIRPLRGEFEKLRIQLSDDVQVFADSQALTTILRNLFRNAASHGKATSIEVSTKTKSKNRAEIAFEDNGDGLKGERELLGRKFQRLYRGSGSGIGLFLSKQLAEKMGGDLHFPNSNSGFKVIVELPVAEEGV